MDKLQNKIPEVRFPEFKEDWEVKKLSELVNRVTTKNKENNSNVCTISAQHGLISQLEYFNKSVSAKNITGYYLLNKNDFAYNKSYSKGYPMGAIKRLKRYEKGVVSTLYICFRNNSLFDNSFAEQYYESGNQNKNIQKVAQEGARNHGLLNIALNDFFSIPIAFPTLPEQKKIAHFFSIVDKKINQLQEKKTALELYKKGIMQQIFSQQIRFKDDNGADFSEWEVKTLGDIGKIIGGGTPESSNPSFWEGEIPWISSSNIYENNINEISISRYISKEALKQSATKLIPKKSILIVSRVGIGKIAVSNQELCTSQDFSNFIPININSYFLAYYFLAKKNRFLSLAQGTSIKGFTGTDIRNLKFEIPNSKKEQNKIANFLTKIDDKINTVNEKIEQTKAYKKGLLQRMFV